MNPSKEPTNLNLKTLNSKSIWWVALGIVVLTVLSMWVCAKAYHHLKTVLRDYDSSIVDNFPANGPELQTHEARDYLAISAASAKKLNQYRWIDKETRTVQIPIERAMQLISEEN